MTKSRWHRVIPCFNYFFEKLSGTVTIINCLWKMKILRGGILVILFDSCVLDLFMFKLYALLTREGNNLAHAWACQKYHA